MFTPTTFVMMRQTPSPRARGHPAHLVAYHGTPQGACHVPSWRVFACALWVSRLCELRRFTTPTPQAGGQREGEGEGERKGGREAEVESARATEMHRRRGREREREREAEVCVCVCVLSQ